MTYIKKLHLEGFKSFAKPTDLILNKGMNVVVGANGSGKSNVTDAICFVLGRLKIKSMRASKAANLIYHGGKEGKPSHTAKVSVVFDNTDKSFSMPQSEVELARIVKRDGTSTYKINNETKTRQEIIELLASAGIDPEGFNIIMQNEISTIIQMKTDEKRQIVEEIAGISIYEERKIKSVNELNKTEERLKEVKTILNERAAFMRNLEREKEQAEKYEKTRQAIMRDRASILWKNIDRRKKNASKIIDEINEKEKAIGKIKAKMGELNSEIAKCKQTISEIDESIAKKTGIEQEKLRDMTLNLKTQLSGMALKKENWREQLEGMAARKLQLESTLVKMGQEIKEIEESEKEEKAQKGRGKEAIAEKETEKAKIDLEKTKNKLAEIELQKHQFYILQNEVSKRETKMFEKENYLFNLNDEINDVKKEINGLHIELGAIRENETMISLTAKRQEDSETHKKLMREIEGMEKELMHLSAKKEIHKKDFESILSLDKCPVCKQIVSKQHKETLTSEFKSMIEGLELALSQRQETRKAVAEQIKKIAFVIEKTIERERRLELCNETKAELEKKESILNKLCAKRDSLKQEIETITSEIVDLKKKIARPELLETELSENKTKIEALQEKLMKMKVDKYEFSDRDNELEKSMRIKEIETAKAIIKSLDKEKIETEMRLKSVESEIIQKQKELDKNEKDQERINKEFKVYLEKKQKMQDEIYSYETKINEFQTKKVETEVLMNNLKIDNARVGAEIETFDHEFKESGFENVEIAQNISIEELEGRLKKNEIEFQAMGAVNLKALEVYDQIKADYDDIAARVLKLEEEKAEILKIIAEIDKKKKHAFMTTFNAINESFSQNFALLDLKGREAFLELENKEDVFAGGLDIVIKLGKGKYMDADSLSGGEKVITALALLFSIQKYKPYSFYVFDEIEPALDKHNSERFAELLKTSIKESQCIIISHNDAVINQADTLYGASMQDGVSKVIGLRV
jgi:chromosome segregation protein